MSINPAHLLALAAQETVSGSAPASASQGPGLTEYMLLFGAILIFFWFIVLRPQKREQQQTDAMRSAIKKGDRVKSIGGIHGTVAAVNTSENIITVEVDKNVKLDFDRNAIQAVVRKEDAKAAAPEKNAKS